MFALQKLKHASIYFFKKIGNYNMKPQNTSAYINFV